MRHRRRLVEANKREINEIVRRHRGRSVSLFGSVARGDETPTSDIDFLVDFEPGSSLFDLSHIGPRTRSTPRLTRRRRLGGRFESPR